MAEASGPFVLPLRASRAILYPFITSNDVRSLETGFRFPPLRPE